MADDAVKRCQDNNHSHPIDTFVLEWNMTTSEASASAARTRMFEAVLSENFPNIP